MSTTGIALSRSASDAPATRELDKIELTLLDYLVSDKASPQSNTLAHYLTQLARLGCSLDSPPGNVVM